MMMVVEWDDYDDANMNVVMMTKKSAFSTLFVTAECNERDRKRVRCVEDGMNEW